MKGIFDKGKEKGALIITETDIKLKENENLLCTLSSTTFARGDGGFGMSIGRDLKKRDNHVVCVVGDGVLLRRIID